LIWSEEQLLSAAMALISKVNDDITNRNISSASHRSQSEHHHEDADAFGDDGRCLPAGFQEHQRREGESKVGGA